jgi:rubredoxin
MNKRQQFLNDYLGALGAKDLLFSDIGPGTISGTVVYDPSDPEERQDFCWHACEADVPSDDTCRLAALIRREGLLDIDKLRVSRDDLRKMYNQSEPVALSPADFDKALDTLEEVRVRMVDDGEETDTYFIHE